MHKTQGKQRFFAVLTLQKPSKTKLLHGKVSISAMENSPDLEILEKFFQPWPSCKNHYKNYLSKLFDKISSENSSSPGPGPGAPAPVRRGSPSPKQSPKDINLSTSD